VQRLNRRLIYCSLKGFLPGPYGDLVALDEVVQVLSGLAYMTGPPGQPLRAGTSITDILGGVFGALGVLAALRERERGDRESSNSGALVESALFETAAFLMGQHMAYSALASEPVPPMPSRISAWAVYELFDSKDGQRVFVGITSDKHWEAFCREFRRPDLFADASLATNTQRIDGRPRLLPEVKALFAGLSALEIVERCQRARLPCAPVGRPEDLFDDPHLIATDGLAETAIGDGRHARLPKLPIRIDGAAFQLRGDPPAVGADTEEILGRIGGKADCAAPLRLWSSSEAGE
jgi:crotonobetainyl-CoA:carnitine CoA-transferase CaiB-like acyl-CoA transferase